MKTSIVVIAHNEEKYIRECLSSLMHQTQPVDEIIVVAHNCTDTTVVRAAEYPVVVLHYDGPKGIVAARLHGIRAATGDCILCIDGDSCAEKNWVEVMIQTLTERNNILVGSWIQFKGTLFGTLSNLYNRFLCASTGMRATRWIWGASFAFRAPHKDMVIDILNRSIVLSAQLRLSRNPEDYWLALKMQKEGNIQVTNKTHVTPHTKERSSTAAIARNRENNHNGRKIRVYMKNNYT